MKKTKAKQQRKQRAINPHAPAKVAKLRATGATVRRATAKVITQAPKPPRGSVARAAQDRRRARAKLAKVDAQLAATAAPAAPVKAPVPIPVGTQPITPTDAPQLYVEAGVPVPKREHPARKPSKPMVIQRGHYAVFRDFHNHHCIRVDVGAKYVRFIAMAATGLEVRQLSHDRFANEYSQQCAYPLERAAQIFARVANGGGYTAEVQQHLEAILNGQGNPAAATTRKEAAMATKKAKKAQQPAKALDPKQLIQKGNPEALAKARAAKGGKPAKVNDEQRYVVALNNTRSGHMKTFLDAAEKFGKRGFKRADLVDATKKALGEERATNYFGYCVYKKLFKAA